MFVAPIVVTPPEGMVSMTALALLVIVKTPDELFTNRKLCPSCNVVALGIWNVCVVDPTNT